MVYGDAASRLHFVLHLTQRRRRQEGRKGIGRAGDDARRIDGRGYAVIRQAGAENLGLRRRERFVFTELALGLLAAQIEDHAANDDEAGTEAAQMIPVGDAVLERFVVPPDEGRDILEHEPYADDDEGGDVDDADPPTEPD